MEFRHLRYFLAVAETNNFRRAAACLHVSQPTLSQQIQQLEKELETTLFDRIGKRVRLTAAGETFRHHARLVLHEMSEAQVALLELDGLKRGRLNVGVVQTVNTSLIPHVIARFTTFHPEVFLNIEEHTASRIEEELLYGRLNMGVSFIPPSGDEIESEALFDEELVLIVSSRHRLARKSFLKMAALEGERLILLPTPYHPRQLFDEKATEIGIRPKVVAEMNSIEGILAAVIGCGGATVLPNLAMSNKTSGLRAISLVEPTPRRTVGLTWRQNSYRCKATEAFRQFSQEAATKYALGIGTASGRRTTISSENRTH